VNVSKTPRIDLADRVELQAKEIASLTDEVLELRRLHRADLDRLLLELEAVKLFVAESHPGFWERFAELRERALHEIPPE
jgi:hypothetical protein